MEYDDDKFILEVENLNKKSITKYLNKKKQRNLEKINNGDKQFTKKNEKMNMKNILLESLEKPIEKNNIGYKLLKKMGFNDGGSIGLNNKGLKEPINFFKESQTLYSKFLYSKIKDNKDDKITTFNFIQGKIRSFLNNKDDLLSYVKIWLNLHENRYKYPTNNSKIKDLRSGLNIFSLQIINEMLNKLLDLIKDEQKDQSFYNLIDDYILFLKNLDIKSIIKFNSNPQQEDHIILELSFTIIKLKCVIYEFLANKYLYCVHCSVQFDALENFKNKGHYETCSNEIITNN